MLTQIKILTKLELCNLYGRKCLPLFQGQKGQKKVSWFTGYLGSVACPPSLLCGSVWPMG